MPPALWHHLGRQFGVAAPDLASLRAMYRRAPTLIEHQQLACEALHFRWFSEHQRRALLRALRDELTRTVIGTGCSSSPGVGCTIIVHERSLRSMIAAAVRQYETRLAKSIQASVEVGLLERWRQTLIATRVGTHHAKLVVGSTG